MSYPFLSKQINISNFHLLFLFQFQYKFVTSRLAITHMQKYDLVGTPHKYESKFPSYFGRIDPCSFVYFYAIDPQAASTHGLLSLGKVLQGSRDTIHGNQY